jgi:WD40 repeat protein
LLASGSRDATIRLWSPEGAARAVLRGHQRTVWDLAFTPDGVRLLSSSFDRDVRVWDARDGACLGVLAGHTRQVGTVTALDAHSALSGSRDGTCRLWDLATGEFRALRPHELPGAKETR